MANVVPENEAERQLQEYWASFPSGRPPMGCYVCGKLRVGYLHVAIGGVERRACNPVCASKLERMAEVVG